MIVVCELDVQQSISGASSSDVSAPIRPADTARRTTSDRSEGRSATGTSRPEESRPATRVWHRAVPGAVAIAGCATRTTSAGENMATSAPAGFARRSRRAPAGAGSRTAISCSRSQGRPAASRSTDTSWSNTSVASCLRANRFTIATERKPTTDSRTWSCGPRPILPGNVLMSLSRGRERSSPGMGNTGSNTGWVLK